MALIDIQYVKDNFEEWEEYCTVPNSAIDPEKTLSRKIALAEAELLEYVTVDQQTISDSLKKHLLNLIRYQCFLIKHGDTQFEYPPAIVKDYNKSISILEKYRKGEIKFPPDPPNADKDDVRFSAKDRQFDEWFF